MVYWHCLEYQHPLILAWIQGGCIASHHLCQPDNVIGWILVPDGLM